MSKYYIIDEDAARRAKQANSYSDYVEGSATQSYQRMVDHAVEIAERQKARVSEESGEMLEFATRRQALEWIKDIRRFDKENGLDGEDWTITEE